MGSTARLGGPVFSWPDHPHVRGEHLGRTSSPLTDGGPSPRAWGALQADPTAAVDLRTIPTCVGSTSRAQPSSVARPDHPHVRGEHCTPCHLRLPAHGPSPRAWGAPGQAGSGNSRPWTIPTCVGSTVAVSPAPESSTDHPHVRGEHPRPQGGPNGRGGPSPRAWGAQKMTCSFRGRYLLVINLLGIRRFGPPLA
ncbi:conserved hypothetical protein [Thermobifida fusca YX]|nr:conserved hypothetical protein [Thermobifida fusca YX]